ncbi:MAG: glycerophosphodiester phosphodiesterase [Bdellovibrionota bacterium]
MRFGLLLGVLSPLALFGACAHHARDIASIPGWIVIAHRSASGYLPEHTLVGVAMAAGWGVDFVEPDVVLTRDSIPVVLHDIQLETSTDVAKKFPFRNRADGHYYVSDFRLKEIKLLHVMERGKDDKPDEAAFPNRFPRTLNRSSFEIPTFEEYLEFVEGIRHSTHRVLGVFPEIKHSEIYAKSGQDIVKIVYEMLARFGYEKKPNLAFIQSFNPKDLQRLKNEMETKIPLVQLIGKNSWKESSADYDTMITPEGLRAISRYAATVSPSLDQLFSFDAASKHLIVNSFVADAHAAGLKVVPYTHRQDPLPAPFKDNDQFFSVLKNEAHIDGLFSDFADEVLIWEGRLKRSKDSIF